MEDLPPSLLRLIGDKLYEKRKQAALEVEQIVKRCVAAGDFNRIRAIVDKVGRQSGAGQDAVRCGQPGRQSPAPSEALSVSRTHTRGCTLMRAACRGVRELKSSEPAEGGRAGTPSQVHPAHPIQQGLISQPRVQSRCYSKTVGLQQCARVESGLCVTRRAHPESAGRFAMPCCCNSGPRHPHCLPATDHRAQRASELYRP